MYLLLDAGSVTKKVIMKTKSSFMSTRNSRSVHQQKITVNNHHRTYVHGVHANQFFHEGFRVELMMMMGKIK